MRFYEQLTDHKVMLKTDIVWVLGPFSDMQ